jgi:Uma2 family endonuclease
VSRLAEFAPIRPRAGGAKDDALRRICLILRPRPARNNLDPRPPFWFGGPDFGIEIVSPDDRSRQKLGFYEKVGTRELLLIDRDPWRLELYRLTHGELSLVGASTPDDPQPLRSEVLGLTWRLVAGQPRPQIEIAHDDGRRWLA